MVVAAAVAAAAWAVGVGRPVGLGPAGGPPRFEEETATAGVAHTYDGPFAFFVGGGVAVFDCDGDRRPDLYVAGGATESGIFRNDGPTGGALHFTQITSPTTDLTAVTGAYPIDVDGDGVVDLAVLRNGEDVLLRGTGGCGFARANERWAFDGGDRPTTAFSATWEGAASLPTLAFGSYVDQVALDAPDNDPNHLCAENVLVRPVAGGTGYAAPLPLTPSWCALSMLFSDWDRSGRSDLRISNDRHFYIDGEEQLWRIEPGAAPRLYTADEGWVRVSVEGMGIASYDLTGDTYPEVYLTSQGSNRLQTLTAGASQPTYRDIGLKRGVLADRPFTGGDQLPSTAWHPEFDDVNDDGLMDLFVSKGNVHSEEDFAVKDPSNLLLGRADGTFVESADAAGILEFDRGRGAALVDFNLDGLLDLVEVHLGAPVRIWRNVGAGTAEQPAPMGHWLEIRVTQGGPNRDGIGSWLEVRASGTTIRRELTIGGGHAGGELGWVHVGLGSAGDAEVRLVAPDGTDTPWQRVTTNQFLDIAQVSGVATPWQPPSG
ncbi:MAG TPA: VCBS repeat-containing protein [Candidatus Limnocylindrales bacterium]